MNQHDITKRSEKRWTEKESKRTHRGSAISSKCPRGGSIWLVSSEGSVKMPTTCKTWRCKGCRDRLKSVFSARVEAGVYSLGRCAFMTLTYKMTSDSQRDALSVRKDWQEFWRRYKAKKYPKVQWLRVVEITKKGQPHLHVVMGPIEGRINCYGDKRIDARLFTEAMGNCDCLSHRMSELWLGVTGDSWHVHTMLVRGAGRAGAYLFKYMAKTLTTWADLEALGFKRRYSNSKSWPGRGRVRLQGSLEKRWYKRIFSNGQPIIGLREPYLNPDHPFVRQKGGAAVLAITNKHKLAAIAAGIRKVGKQYVD